MAAGLADGPVIVTVSWHRRSTRALCAVIVTMVFVEAVAEVLFWAEFETRFNFLAVEYLIYREEVARNILESHAVGTMVVALLAAAMLLLWLLRFSNVFATGTRTVRGLEALALSIPPTPGHSIVKRPGSGDGLRTIGLPFLDRAYDTAFLSGGHGYFDNVNAFFGGAGFRVVDRRSFSRNEVTFSNAWGVADENLFDRVLKEADVNWGAGRPFMFFTLTASNHRPYTFPEGRIDLPQRQRGSAVKYTDWAIGKFLDDARRRPWFDQTLFVNVADHCARSGGRTELPLNNFRIPLFFYAPSLIPPQRVTRLASQIDVAPTLLSFLG